MKKYIYGFIIVLLVSIISIQLFYSSKRINAYGTVIVLNGPSASGKSSIQK